MRSDRVVLVAAMAILLRFSALPAQSHVVRVITFTGAPGYSQQELLAFSGLKPGDAISEQQIEDASQKLGDTGLFEDVSFSGNDAGLTFTLKPIAAKATLPVAFANFVWWPDSELEKALGAKVPLYHGGGIPVSGNLRQAVSDALAAMATEKGLAGVTVSSRPSSSGPGAPIDRIVFSIDNPPITVHSITLAGASPAMAPKLNVILKDLSGQPWDQTSTRINLSGRISDVYLNEGYRDIAVTQMGPPTVAAAATGVTVDVSAVLEEGPQYRVKQLAWPGSELLSAEDFRNRAQLRVGDPDSPLKLAETLELLHDAYASKGYIEAKIEAPPEVDHNVHAVSYTVSVAQGPQYHFRSVRFPNVSADQEKQLNSEWKMKPGDVYDSSYAIKFFQGHPGLIQHGYTLNLQEVKDPGALMVDLTVRINKPGAPPQP